MQITKYEKQSIFQYFQNKLITIQEFSIIFMQIKLLVYFCNFIGNWKKSDFWFMPTQNAQKYALEGDITCFNFLIC